MPGLDLHEGPTISLIQEQDVELTTAYNLTITVIGVAGQDGVKHVTDIHADREACRKLRWLRTIIDVSADGAEITLGEEMKRIGSNKNGEDEGENLEGLLVVLAHDHGLMEYRMQQLGLYGVSILGVWYAIAYLERDRTGSAKAILGKWFAKWYATCVTSTELSFDLARALAFPCQFFDHAAGFANVTKWLACNNVGHIKERSPTGFRGSRGFHLAPNDFVSRALRLNASHAMTDTVARSAQPCSRKSQIRPAQEPVQAVRQHTPLRYRQVQLLGLHSGPILVCSYQDQCLPCGRCVQLLFRPADHRPPRRV